MLHLMLGRARSGKTAAVMEAVRRRMEAGQAGTVLLVPEQYSHEAETELLRVCGDRLSLFAEVLSFSRLASRVEEELGGGRRSTLDPGGKLLCLVRALEGVSPHMKLLRNARRQAPLQLALLRAVDECKSGGIGPEALRGVSAPGPLRDKLEDLALVYEGYEAVAAQSGLDPLDRLELLAERLPESRYAKMVYYIDGFTDFTALEAAVIDRLLRGGAEVTVCLTCLGLEEGHEIFEPSRRAALRLREMAERAGTECEIQMTEPPAPADAMAFLERELFAFGDAAFDAGDSVRLLRAETLREECEAAAARCLELVRETGCRWRDIAIAARSFEAYRTTLETVFRYYGVPLYAARRSDLLSKPLPAMVAAAYAIITRGWEYEDVFSYLKTGLAGLETAECDALENYAFLWSLRGRAWSGEEDWVQHPEGFGREPDEASAALLAELNRLRRRATAPLKLLAERSAAAATAREQAGALADFFEALALPDQLQRRAQALKGLGMVQEAAEYVQLWELILGALEQSAAVLGETEMDAEAFGTLFCTVLSAYDTGTIPMTLDRVTAGDMGRMRRRHIRHLLVLGCDSDSVPQAAAEAGVFTDEDRSALQAAGLTLGDTAEGRLNREFALLYNCLTLPSETLSMSWCAASGAGLPAFVIKRAEHIFRIRPLPVDSEACRQAAPGPALELAAAAARRFHSPASEAARQYFLDRGRGAELDRFGAYASLGRGNLSPASVRALYGERPRLSASRVERLAGCRFGFFLQYGLRAKPRQAASFSPPELGSFMHYILEHTAREVQAAGGFAQVSPQQLQDICDRHVEQYIHEKLNDFRQKSPRFVYLFRRLTRDVRAVVTDMAEELKRGDFVPLDFELDFGKGGDFPSLELGEGENALALTGVADRVDGWVHEGKLYLRVVDYKTGVKSFSLSDVWYGLGLQMLLYLFALEKGGKARYHQEIVPAGVLYIPARDVLVSARTRLTPEEILAEKAKKRRRSGLLLDDPDVLEAMEHGQLPRYIPVTYNKDGRAAGEALASAQRLGLLSGHIDATLKELAGQLRAGSILADPWFRSQTENACRFCDYQEACHWDEEKDRVRYIGREKNGQVWDRLEKEAEEHGL